MEIVWTSCPCYEKNKQTACEHDLVQLNCGESAFPYDSINCIRF